MKELIPYIQTFSKFLQGSTRRGLPERELPSDIYPAFFPRLKEIHPLNLISNTKKDDCEHFNAPSAVEMSIFKFESSKQLRWHPRIAIGNLGS